MMEVTACDACGLLLTMMMRVGRPWGRARVFWGKFRGEIEGRMVGVRERERRYRGRQCEREPESKEGLVPHPSQPTCWVPTSGFYVSPVKFARTRSLLQLCSFFSPFPDNPPRPPWTVITTVPLWSSTTFCRFFLGLPPIPPQFAVG